MTLDVINKKHIGNLKSNEFNSWKLSIKVAEKKDQSKDLDALPPWPILTSRLVTARCFGISYKTPLVKMIVTWVYRENSKLDEAISRTSRLLRQRFFRRKKARYRGEVVSWSASG